MKAGGMKAGGMRHVPVSVDQNQEGFTTCERQVLAQFIRSWTKALAPGTGGSPQALRHNLPQ